MNRTAIIGVLLLTAALLGGAVCCADAYDAQDTGEGSSGASYIFYVADADGKLEMKQGTIGEFHTVTSTRSQDRTPPGARLPRPAGTWSRAACPSTAR